MTEAVRKRLRDAACLLAATGSGILLAAGFAPWESMAAAWGAFIPLLFIARFRPAGESFRWGFLSGLVTWLPGLWWLTALHETAGLPKALILPGCFGLAAYCALYTAVFAWAVSRWFQWAGGDSLWKNILSLVAIPAIWCGLEYWRGVLFTGFPWNPAGATQAGNPVSQLAELGGTYLVSGVIVLFNTSVVFAVARYLNWRTMKARRPTVELTIGVVVLMLAFRWGQARQLEYGSGSGNLLVGIVQPAIAQNVKWDETFVTEVQDTLERLSGEAVEMGEALARKRPDLVIWPETSTPGEMTRPEYRALIEAVARRHGPILLGTLYNDGTNEFNTALLIDREGKQAGRYDKQHLVPFGEYLPFDKWIPALQDLSPLGVSLSAGGSPTVLREPGTGAPFSVTICFEDIFPELSRRFVREGARLLVNQSNDAWFDGTAEHRQHLALSIMRCIENRVPGVRVSNSGASGFIEPNGRVYRTGVAEGEDGWLGAAGALPDGQPLADVALVNLPAGKGVGTLYTRFGDALWALPCAAATAVWIAAALWMDRRKREAKENARE